MPARDGDEFDSRSGLRVGIDYLLTGLSFVVPFAVLGGFLVAVVARVGTETVGAFALHQLDEVGRLALGLVFPALGGFVAYAIADRPGLAPGFVLAAAIDRPELLEAAGTPLGVEPVETGGVIAVCATGFLTGVVVRHLTNRSVPSDVRPVYPILVVPLVATAVVGPVVLVAALPAALVNSWMISQVTALGTVGGVVVGAGLGTMMAWDLGGPVNKIAYLLAIAAVVEGVTTVTATAMIAGMTPPLGFAVAAMLAPDRAGIETATPRETLSKGCLFITEGAIPYVECAPSKRRTVAVAGSVVAGAFAMARSVELAVPHGGILVVPLSPDPIGFVAALLCGTAVTVVGALLRGESA